MEHRLKHLEPVLAGRERLATLFRDRHPDGRCAAPGRRFDGLADHPASRSYIARATAGPSFVKEHADQMAHFAATDRSIARPR